MLQYSLFTGLMFRRETSGTSLQSCFTCSSNGTAKSTSRPYAAASQLFPHHSLWSYTRCGFFEENIEIICSPCPGASQTRLYKVRSLRNAIRRRMRQIKQNVDA